LHGWLHSVEVIGYVSVEFVIQNFYPLSPSSTLQSMQATDVSFGNHIQVLVFCTTARVTALMAELYKKLGLNTLEIHSRKSQVFRTRVSDEFRKSRGGVIMFTSDVSARGIDYPDVTLVVQVRFFCW
jgi:superfamily II DNA/RNA helicase